LDINRDLDFAADKPKKPGRGYCRNLGARAEDKGLVDQTEVTHDPMVAQTADIATNQRLRRVSALYYYGLLFYGTVNAPQRPQSAF
jgi:N-formylglutamate amidohydrolase